jgi:PQQ-like domain
MQNSSSAKIITVFIIALLMTSSLLLATKVQAKIVTIGGSPTGVPNGSKLLPSGVTADMIIGDIVVVAVRPHTLGIGQPVLINFWLEPPVALSRYITGFELALTKPDGSKETMTLNSFQGDSTGYVEYIPDQLGTWKVDLTMPGAYFPAGNYTVPLGISGIAGAGGVPYTETFTRSLYYKPSNAVQQTFIVQSEAVASWPAAPLPTDYWTRPVEFENREWATILGDYPWWGSGGGSNWPADTNPYWSAFYQFTPYVQGPTSAHIVWKRQGPFGGASGLIGEGYNAKSVVTAGGGPNLIYQGRCYQTYAGVLPNSPGTPCTWWQCYDLRTGQVYWNRPLAVSGGTNSPAESAPSYIEYSTGAEAVPGAEFATGVTVSLIAINAATNVPTYPGSQTQGGSVYTSTTTATPGTMVKYSPITGAVTLNITLPTPVMSSHMYYMNGYVLSIQTVNTTGGPGEPGTPTMGIYRMINWTTQGTSTNFTSRVMSNTTWPNCEFGGSYNFQDFNTGMTFLGHESNFQDLGNMGSPYVCVQNNLNPLAYVPASQADNASGVRLGTTIEAISLTTGKRVYTIVMNDLNDPAGDSAFSGSAEIADHGKVAIAMRDGTFDVFDQATGKLLFKTSPKADAPWDITGFGAYGISSAYGMWFHGQYGAFYAYNWTNGNIVWKFSAPAAAPYESPYTDANGTAVYPWYSGSGLVADGKVYIYNSEHTATQPITRGWSLWCLNAYTGEEIWNITTPGAPSAIADGYLSVSGTDGYQYVFGRGLSKTTISAPDIAVTGGTSVVIKGTVMDQSPAQPNTPCVSHDSMKTQMEYLHRQLPIDGIWHSSTIAGVKVSLTALDSNGNYEDLGIVTTDGYYGTFSITWTPPIAGDYKIIASFAGDDSYGSSTASTTMSVGPTSTASPTTVSEQVTADYSMTIIGTGLAVIVAVAIVGALIMLMFKRRP